MAFIQEGIINMHDQIILRHSDNTTAVRGQVDSISRHGSFELVAPHEPAGDQPRAIDLLEAELAKGANETCLLGVTGSGKTFTIASLVERVNRPTMVLSHNKTLAAQLYAEFRGLFPGNAVEYFVSYYDYYQPEAYVPSKDLFIGKDSSINEQIEQLRLSATKSLIERNDVLVVATVSAIFGIGDPVDYHSMVLHLRQGDKVGRNVLVKRLVDMQYRRDKYDFNRGTFRVRGDTIDIFPSEQSELAVRVQMFDNEIEQLNLFDPLTGAVKEKMPRFTVYPSSLYVVPEDTVERALKSIKAELKVHHAKLIGQGKMVEAQRLKQRTQYDLEMMTELGFCTGIENYSRHFSRREPGEPPPTLFDYLPTNGLLFIDESHATVPQLGAMYKGDRSRKETLVEYGFRLPSAMDNRPLKFDEFEDLRPSTIYVSATLADFERERSSAIVEMVVRPTGLVDPTVEVRPASTQVDDLLSQIKIHVERGERALVTTLTKRMAEQLSEFLADNQINARYLHADIDTLERAELIHQLRAGSFDVLVGINLLREGLDLPEVSLVAVLDADKEGFLRSERSLIQTIGRTARNVNGLAILYADKETGSIRRALAETDRRRAKQVEHNKKHNITPRSIIKSVESMIEINSVPESDPEGERSQLTVKQAQEQIVMLEQSMHKAAGELEFEKAAELRDQIRVLNEIVLGLPAPTPRSIPGDPKSRLRQNRQRARKGQGRRGPA